MEPGLPDQGPKHAEIDEESFKARLDQFVSIMRMPLEDKWLLYFLDSNFTGASSDQLDRIKAKTQIHRNTITDNIERLILATRVAENESL